MILVTLLVCSSVYVASAAIGLVLGLVLGLNLGLEQLCGKVGSIVAVYALHAGSFIPLTWGKISLSCQQNFTFDIKTLGLGLRLWLG